MHVRPDSLREVINRLSATYTPRAGATGVRAALFAAILLVSIRAAVAQDAGALAVPGPGIDPGAPPTAQSGDVQFFSQDLGTILRLRYNTVSYGQDGSGNFDIGTMQVVTMEDSAVFLDGQVTMNDTQGVGFNIGVGYRWIDFPPYAADGRMEGVSLWVDGTSTEAGNFFPQIGLSYESLGDMWDVRANAYLPVGPQQQEGDFETTGDFGFEENSIIEVTEGTADTSFFVGEIELARRLGTERDAWGFVGPYFLANDDDSAAGARAGVRGYAYPDLLVQVSVSHDEIFDTTATFLVEWFVGRTRTDFRPACGIPDRFREPVRRNDYVVLDHHRVTDGIKMTNPDRTPLRVVHVDSNAPAGGDGTFEDPFNSLAQVNAGSQTGDIILAHANSNFTTGLALKNNQRFLGEGDGNNHTVDTFEEGTITIPETSPGAQNDTRPAITGAAGDAVTLASDNEVSNFTIDGNNVTARAIATSATSAGTQDINNLVIQQTTGTAIDLTHAAAATAAMTAHLNDIDITNLGAGAMGLNIMAQNANNFTLLVEDNTINTGNDAIAFQLTFTGAFTDDDSDVIIRRNTVTTGNNSAFRLLADDVQAKTITAQWQTNTFTNNSAAIDTADMDVLGNSTLNATVTENTFTNVALGGDELDMTANGAAVTLNLDLLDNSANDSGGAGNGQFALHNVISLSTFGVVQKTATFNNTRNLGNVTRDPNDAAFTDLGAGPIPTPTFP
jgi:hypothetical protein